ncbi:MAG: amidohydrolase/deacetylase family metallohydrolase [Candidatus Rokubacteria bacterium]|nr:amidohydrolase/deacetylase family metallohydrolase [Candidatus Rokubacteria bacterium]
MTLQARSARTADILIRGGTVIDPSQGLHALRDVRLGDGRVVEVGDSLQPHAGEEVVDARRALVVPGLIDLHVHVFWGGSHYGIEPDPHCLATGTTTVVDAGSAGALTFPLFRRYVIEVAQTRILPFLNLSATGMLSPAVGELELIPFIDKAAALRTIEAHRDLIQGIKVRLSRDIVGQNARVALKTALEASEAARLPIMVHVGDTPIPLAEILDELRPGDVLSHCFHGRAEGILDPKGAVLAEARRAAGRGVNFDVGHGKGSFAFAVAREALAQGLRPGTISSDLHAYNLDGPVFDLATTMSKFLHLGLALDEVVGMTTAAPARLLRGAAALGTLKPGAAADVTLLDLREGRFTLEDTVGEKISAPRRLIPIGVIRNGVQVTVRPSYP